MAVELELYDKDESIESPRLSRAFLEEILLEWYIDLKSILSQAEYKIAMPNSDGEVVLGYKRKPNFFDKLQSINFIRKAQKGTISVETVNKHRNKLIIRSEKIEDRERCPHSLKKLLKLIQSSLQENCSDFPLIHKLFDSNQLNNEICSLVFNGVEASVHGDLFHYEKYNLLRNKFHLKSYLGDYGKVDEYIEVKPKLIIEGRKYFSKTITKAKQFEQDFNRCYNYLNKAIASNIKVIWEFG